MAGSRIAVEVTGNSSELQSAVAKAADSLKGLADVVAKTSESAVRSSETTIRANQAVARSFEGALAAARTNARSMTESMGVQARAATESATVQKRAAQETAAAQEGATAKIVASSQRRVKAFGDESAAATRYGRSIATGMVAAAAASVYVAAKFQSSTEQLRTQAGASQRQVEQLRRGMLDLAASVGTAPLKLEAGMYHVVSSMNAVLPRATRVREELQILKVAAEGAQIGGANLEETSYALASAMNALHQRGRDAQQTMADLNAIVGAGDMTMSDLLEALKSGLLPTAQTFGVSLKSVGAALAVMGDMGMRGALAGTRLRMSLALLAAPSEKAAKLLEDIGMSSKQAIAQSDLMAQTLQKAGLRVTTLSEDLRQPNGLQVALQDLDRHLRQSGLSADAAGALISRAFGGGRSGAAIQLMAQNTDRLRIKFDQIGRQAGQFGQDWQARTHTLRFQLDQVGAEFEKAGIKLGTFLIPKVEAGIEDFKDLAHWLDQNRVAAGLLAGAATAVGTALVGSFALSKLRGATQALRELGGLGRTGGGGILGGVARSVEGGGMGIGGMRSGLGLPGSMANPIAVLNVDGAAGVPSIPGKTAATAEEVAAAEGAAGGVLSKVAGGFNELLGRGLRAGMIAGIGTLASQAAGNVIGGNAGRQIAKTGSSVATGAAFGSLLGPEGTAAGALFGGLLSLDTGHVTPEMVQKFKYRMSPMQAKVAVDKASFQAAQQAFDDMSKAGQKARERVVSDFRAMTGDTVSSVRQLREQLVNETLKIDVAFAGNSQKAKDAMGANIGAAVIELSNSMQRGTLSVQTGMAEILHQVTQQTGASKDITAENFRLAIAAIQQAVVGQGPKVTQQGLDEINTLFRRYLGMFGISGQAASLYLSHRGSKTRVNASQGPADVGAPGAAQGALIQFGQPGAAGKDSILANIAGHPIMVGSGEVAAVFTRHQLAAVNQRLADMGGLAGVFDRIKTPHFMAQGGFVPAAGTNFSVGQEPIIARDLNRLGQMLHLELIGISGYRSPQHSVAVGGFANDPHTRGLAADVGAPTRDAFGRLVSNAALRSVGLYRPFGGPAEINHVQLLAAAMGVRGAPGAAALAAGLAASGAAPSIATPRIGGPTSALKALVQAGLANVTAAANQRLGTLGGGGGISPLLAAGVSGSAERIGRAMMIAAGWPASEWPALKALWTKESGWNPYAVNPSSGAYGIPQSLGHGRPYALGDVRGQIAWGLNYIRGRYGSPSAAWAHEVANNWYGRGGILRAAVGATISRATHHPGSTTKKVAAKKVKFTAADNPLVGRYLKDQSAISTLQTSYPALESLFQSESADGTMTPAQSSQVAGMIGQILTDLKDEQQLIPRILATLGVTESNAQTAVKLDTRKLADNASRENQIRGQLLLLSKPVQSQVPRLQKLIKETRLRYERLKASVGTAATPADRAQLAALRAQLATIPAGKAHTQQRKALEAKIRAITGRISVDSAGKAEQRTAINQDEIAAVSDLTTQLLAVQGSERSRHHRIAMERWHLRTRLFTLLTSDKNFRQSLGLAKKVAGGDGVSISDLQQNLATLPAQIWQTTADYNNLRKGSASGLGTDNSILTSLLQQQNDALTQSLSLQQKQTAALLTMIPEIPRYDRGGPVLRDGLIYAHQGEHVVPRSGTLVSGGAPPAEIRIEHHWHGAAGELAQLMDQRIAHPENVRVVSRQIGLRTSQLIGAPGGGRR